MIGVAGNEPVAADAVMRLDSLDYMHREGQAGDPRCTVALVSQIELGGRGVLHSGFGAEVIERPDKQVWLLSAHQIHISHLPWRIAGQGRRPDQAGGAVAKQVGNGDVDEIVHAREDGQRPRRAPTVAGLVEVEAYALAVQVDDVGGAAAVNVG